MPSSLTLRRNTSSSRPKRLQRSGSTTRTGNDADAFPWHAALLEALPSPPSLSTPHSPTASEGPSDPRHLSRRSSQPHPHPRPYHPSHLQARRNHANVLSTYLSTPTANRFRSPSVPRSWRRTLYKVDTAFDIKYMSMRYLHISSMLRP